MESSNAKNAKSSKLVFWIEMEIIPDVSKAFARYSRFTSELSPAESKTIAKAIVGQQTISKFQNQQKAVERF